MQENLCGFFLRDFNQPAATSPPLPLAKVGCSKKRDRQCLSLFLAEMEGFEPPHALRRLPDFESGPFSHLGTSPYMPCAGKLTVPCKQTDPTVFLCYYATLSPPLQALNPHRI